MKKGIFELLILSLIILLTACTVVNDNSSAPTKSSYSANESIIGNSNQEVAANSRWTDSEENSAGSKKNGSENSSGSQEDGFTFSSDYGVTEEQFDKDINTEPRLSINEMVKSTISPDGLKEKQIIKCADSNEAVVEITHSSDGNSTKYLVIQTKGKLVFSASLDYVENTGSTVFIIYNSSGEKLETISGNYMFIDIQFVDVNLDGYLDFETDLGGTLNSSSKLYTWDATTEQFCEVKLSEMLSYYEIHPGYIINWVKDSYYVTYIQELKWTEGALVKVAESRVVLEDLPNE